MAARICWLSAIEFTGFPDSTINARYRFGWSARISSANTLHGISPPITRAPTTGDTGADVGCSSLRPMCSMFPMPVMAYWPPGLPTLPVRSQSSFSR